MRITWFGQAAFKLEGGGASVITDPYTPEELGYAPIVETADVVLTSSADDTAHCRSDLIPGDPVRVNALDIADGAGVAAVGPLMVRAVAAEEWEHHPSGVPDRCAMYRFALDGLEVAHMGDVGNPLTEEQIAFFEGVDVLLALAGGPPTIALPDLMHVIHRTRPKLVVPMHFRTLRCRMTGMQWIESFLRHWRDDRVDFAFDATAEVTRADLAGPPRVRVLDHLR